MWTGARPAACSPAREEKNLNYPGLLLPGRRGQNLNLPTIGSEHLLCLYWLYHCNGASKTMVASRLISLALLAYLLTLHTAPHILVPVCEQWAVHLYPPAPCHDAVTLTVMCDAECHVSRVASPDQDDSQLCLPSPPVMSPTFLTPPHLLSWCWAELAAPSLNLRRHDSHDRTKITIKIHNNGGRGECQCSRIKHPHPTLTPSRHGPGPGPG